MKKTNKIFSKKQREELNKILSQDNDYKLWHDKYVAYYSVITDYWFDARNKESQTIVAVSSGAIGLLIALSSNSDFMKLSWYFVFYPLSLAAFLFCIITGICIYRKNSNYLMAVKKNLEKSEEDKTPLPALEIWDYISIFLFTVGISSAIAFYIMSIVSSDKFINKV